MLVYREKVVLSGLIDRYVIERAISKPISNDPHVRMLPGSGSATTSNGIKVEEAFDALA